MPRSGKTVCLKQPNGRRTQENKEMAPSKCRHIINLANRDSAAHRHREVPVLPCFHGERRLRRPLPAIVRLSSDAAKIKGGLTRGGILSCIV